METVNLKGQLRLESHDKAPSLVLFAFLFPYRVTFYRETVENMPEDSWGTGVSVNISQRSRGRRGTQTLQRSLSLFIGAVFFFASRKKQEGC